MFKTFIKTKSHLKPFLLYCLFLLFVGSFTALSQTSLTSPEKQYLFKNYTTQTGLIDNVNFALKQDKWGYIWIGSYSGLTRFDGKSFYHKAIPEIYYNLAAVTSLETMPSGNLVSNGIMRGIFVQQDDGSFKQHLENGYFEVGRNIFSTLKYYSDGNILAGCSDGMYLLTADSLKQIYLWGYYRGTFCLTIDIDRDNNIWFGGQFGLGFLQQSDTGYTAVFLPELKDKMVQKIIFDEEGTLHVGSNHGYYRIKWHQPGQWDKDYTIEQPFSQVINVAVNLIYFDKEKNLWIPTASYGVFRTKGDSITLHLTKENGLSDSNVLSLLQDREGNYWFATANGVSMIESFDNYAIAQNGVRFKRGTGMRLDSYNRFWIYSPNALDILIDNQLIPISLKGTPLEKEGIKRVALFKSDFYIANDFGLYKIPVTKELPDLQKLEKLADFRFNNFGSLQQISFDSTGLWIVSEKNIYNYSNGKFLPVKFNHPDSVSIRPWNILQDKFGYYWYGDYVLGIYRGTISRPNENKIVFDNITAYKSRNADTSFVTMYIRYMDFDIYGNLWFSSFYTGAYKLILDDNGVVSYKLFSSDNGLINNMVFGTIADNQGRIWIGGQKGVNIVKYDSQGNELMDKIDANNGIIGPIIRCIPTDGKLFILTQEGLFVINDNLFNEKLQKAPNVFITNLLINGVPHSGFSINTNKIRLTHEQNNITIDFSAITFRNTDEVKYQYKLEGINDDWSALSDRGFVEYASLRPGKYNFKVRAVIGGVTGEETTLTFRITPAFYQTIWFYLLIAVALFLLLYAFYKYRIRQAIKMDRMRTRIASDLHDDIGSTLSSISLISEIAKKYDKEEMLAKALSKIGESSRDVLNAMDDIIWSVNPQNDCLSNLIIRLREYAIPVCEAKNIQLIMNVDEPINSLKLDMEERRNAYLIVKEAINNAVKHSGCKNLTVAFVNNHHLEIFVKDDGCGFDITSPTTRNGLVNIESRARHFGAELIIKSEINEGTFVLLKAKNHIC